MRSLSPWRTVESMSGHLASTNFEKEDDYGYELCHIGRDGISDFCGDGWTLSDCYRCCEAAGQRKTDPKVRRCRLARRISRPLDSSFRRHAHEHRNSWRNRIRWPSTVHGAIPGWPYSFHTHEKFGGHSQDLWKQYVARRMEWPGYGTLGAGS